MGLLDRASRSFARASEETVRVVDYDLAPKAESMPKEPKPPKEKEIKAPKERRLPSMASVGKGFLPAKKEVIEPEVETETHKRPPPVQNFAKQATAFAIDDDEPSFYQQKVEEIPVKKSSAALVSNDGAIQDVLNVLNIPATFTIHEEVLMPSDFDDLDFDIQVPQGYDVGQVRFFVEKSEASVKEYLRLLEARNEHIAKLATTVDRLQVDFNNLKYDSQIAAGIGIIPTSESVDLENENMELKLKLQRLNDAKKTTINSEERKVYEEMRNELSKTMRENEDLKEKNYELKSLVAQLEENSDEMMTSPSNRTDHESAEIIFQNIDDEELPAMPTMSSMPEMPASDSMPAMDITFTDLDDSDSNSLTEMPADFTEMPANPRPKINYSSFDVDKEDDFNTAFAEDLKIQNTDNITIMDDENNDDDDELDQLMREWKN